jgi:hypothetical protein
MRKRQGVIIAILICALCMAFTKVNNKLDKPRYD